MRYTAFLLVILLGACTSAAKDQPSVAKAVWERVKALGKDAPEAEGGKATPTRQQITEFNVAMIQMNLEG